MRSVTVIPASIHKFSETPLTVLQKRKVAAYARVSTDEEQQQTSYAAQCDHYERYIRSRSDWEFAGLYADEGVTGCNTKKRDGFNSMIRDALDGKIQLIVTKSVSRFARNTVDSLTTIRKLKEHGIEVWFEKENIRTFDPKVEILLTILASLSQEESRSISENVCWGIRKKMADGRFTMPYSRFLGYDRGEDGGLVINEGQAKIVRRIFGLFLKGMSPYGIARKLTADGIKTVTGKDRWHGEVIRRILENEKMAGMARLQKTFTPDFLTRKQVRNDGQVPSYFIENSHPAIIEPEVFKLVQKMLAAGNSGDKHPSHVSIFSGRIRCGHCGGWYGSKTWHSTDKYKKVVWQCNEKFKGKKCSTPNLSDDDIKRMFVKAADILLNEKEEIIATYRNIRDEMFSTATLQEKQAVLEDEMERLAKLANDYIQENARTPIDQTEYEVRYGEILKRYDASKKECDTVKGQIDEKDSRREQVERFLRQVESLDLITDFDDDLWLSMVDVMTVYTKDDVRFTFKDGSEIRLADVHAREIDGRI